MRKARNFQVPLTYNWLDLDHAKELKALAGLLDQHPTIDQLVLQDLAGEAASDSGAHGMPAEQVFRALLLKQMHRWSYDELHFHLSDSQTFRTFCRMSAVGKTPARSTLASNIKRIKPQTLEAINRLLILDAKRLGIERGTMVRTDCTVVETNIHKPMDSSQLWDCVRVLTRLMGQARELLVHEAIWFPNRTRRAKRRCKEISTTRSKTVRAKAYVDLVKVTEEVSSKAQEVVAVLGKYTTQVPAAIALFGELQHFLELTRRTLDQTRRRVLNGESVPAAEKIVSIFEEHTDIIRKDHRDTYYGHKICLTGGKSSLILDCQILDGNPADSNLTLSSISRLEEIYGTVPRQVTFDGAFASEANLQSVKDLGCKDVVFSKGKSLKASDMAKSLWVFRKLRNFRAGIEGCISFLKRTFGLDRCTWRSLTSFKSYVWGSIVSCNALLIARSTLASAN